jgi:hypothetical protein
MKQVLKMVYIICCNLMYTTFLTAQVTLNADGPGNTYELINSIFAPGYNVVEAPDVAHSAFGRHIAEVFDATVNKNVFEFYSHVTPDNDPSTLAADRQRVEIKTYDQSPANLIGVNGESVTYKWRFKIPVGFQPSSTFTHLHQIKPVGGDDGDPLFTLTARKGTPNKLELTYTAVSSGSTVKPVIVDLSLFEGNWVDATEKVDIGVTGKYSIIVKRVSDGTTLLSYSNNNILTIRADNNFIRPKWGIYRSIVTPADLRDEAVRFSDFSIAESATFSIAGATYYWVGGAAGDIENANSWNTALDGSGSNRNTPDPADVLIFDGTNIGGATPATGAVTPILINSIAIGQLFFQNGVTVTLKRPTGAGGVAPITNAITLNGDGSPADDFIISANSTVNINAELTGYGTNIVLGNAVGPILVTGTIYGTLNIADGGLATTRITAANPGSLFVAAGGSITSNLTLATSYPFGSGGSTPPAGSLGVVFNAGSKLVYVAGNSVLGNTSTFQPAKFNAGSWLEMNANNPTGMFNLKTFANILVKSPAAVTLAENFYNVDTLSINSGATFNMRVTGTSPFSGDIINNGTFGAGAPTSAVLVMIGIVPQTISGTGSITNLGAFTVGTDAQVTVSKNLNIIGTATSTITGKLNLQGNTISGTAPFTMRTAATGATSACTFPTPNTVTFADAATYTAASVTNGARVIGAAFQPNTYVISTSSGTNTFTISKPSTGASGTVTLSTSSPTFETSHAGGFDGAITTTGAKSYGTNVNYIFDGNTTAPFPAGLTGTVGNVTINANVTTNKIIQNVSSALTLNNGILTIRATDTIRVTTATPIAGAPFSSSKYIALQKGATTTGVLRMDALTTPSLFPIGSLTKYIPVTLSPTASMNFAVSVFEGATVDGTVAGVPVSTTTKDESVDANWIINRMSGTGNCGVTLNWPASLEGTTFSGFPDALIGISHYNSGTSSYDPPIGTANNTTNTADAAFSAFSPFLLTKNPLGLPVTLTAVYAIKLPVGTKIIWNVASENSIIKYVVERSNNGIDFTTVGSVNAANYPSYSLNDLTPNKNVFYYRIKIIGYAGYVKYSAAVKVSNGGKQELTVYPNPAKDQIFLSGVNNNSEVKIVNSKGQMMLQQKTNASTFSMDISSLVNGMYVVEIYSEGRLLDSKTIIKK